MNRIAQHWQNYSREQQDTLFLLLVIASVSLPHAQHLPYWAVAVTIAVLFYRAYLADKLKPLPSRWLTLGVLLACVVGTFFTFRSIAGRDPGVTLVMLLLALKTLELKARRDAFVVFFLGFFAVLTHFLFSQSLITAALMLVAVTGLFTALVGAHMPMGKPAFARRLALAGKMMVLGTPLAMALFVFFPRMSSPLWGMPGDADRGRTGLSETMSVGDIGEIAQNDDIAFRVEFEGAAPAPKDLYFRGPVLSSFDGRKWEPLKSRFNEWQQMRRSERVAGAPIKQTITLEPHRKPWLFALESPTDDIKLAGSDVVLTASMMLFASKPVTERVKYSVTSHLQTQHGALQTNVNLQDYLELPPGFNPRAMQYAADVRRDPQYANADGAALAALLMKQINQGYGYTLAPGLYGANSVDEFWFDRKQGFCEHFAQSFVVIMRAFDVPARVVTGYQGAEFNPYDNTYSVRQSHAHAWAEYWQAGTGWVRADPTASVAPERINSINRTLNAQRGLLGIGALSGASMPWLANLRSTWDAVNNGWNQWVLSYTSEKQFNLLKNIGFESPDWASLAVIMIVVAALATALAGAWMVYDKPRRDPWQRLYARAQSQLVKQGLAVTAADAPRGLAARALSLANGSAWQRWLLDMEALRYAPNSTPNRARITDRYTLLKNELKQLKL